MYLKIIRNNRIFFDRLILKKILFITQWKHFTLEFKVKLIAFEHGYLKRLTLFAMSNFYYNVTKTLHQALS